jgi:hypothetical protein
MTTINKAKGVSVHKRERLINLTPPGQSRLYWSKEAMAALGKLPDAEVAKIAGCSVGTVSRKREFHGIPPFQAPIVPGDWDADQLALLGKIPDAKFARMVGAAAQTVRRAREHLGIAPYMSIKRSSAWLPWQEVLLGLMSDTQVARVIDKKPHAVKAQRILLGIPPKHAKHIPKPADSDE